MSGNKREQERAELHNTIWALANELRGSVDGWDFKQYVLGMLFYRYISENLTTYLNKGEWDAGNTDFDYAKISDEEALSIRDDMVQEKGFFILPSELFENLLNRIKKADKDAKDQAEKDGKEVEVADLDENLNEILQTTFKNIEASAIGSASEENFKGLFDDIDVNSNKLGPTVIKRNKRLKKLITVIGDMNLGNYQDNSIDAFGDTYEYLMGMYASNAGKSGGEFFTPQEVSELLTKISLLDNNGKMKTEVNKVSVSLNTETYGDFTDALEKAKKAAREGFGAGSIVYLRKVFERIITQTAEAADPPIETRKVNGNLKPFIQILTPVKDQCNIIPSEFAEDGYKLFGELSDVVHGDYDEDEALQKFDAFYRLVTGVLEKIKTNRELMDAIGTLGWHTGGEENE